MTHIDATMPSFRSHIFFDAIFKEPCRSVFDLKVSPVLQFSSLGAACVLLEI